MRSVQFSPKAITNLTLFRSGNQKLVFKVFELITDIQSNPFQGLSKPEPLKENYKGFCSRRINDEHRLICEITNELIIIHACFGHH